jgi:hypothetical protein
MLISLPREFNGKTNCFGKAYKNNLSRRLTLLDFRFGSISDIGVVPIYVRFTSESGHRRRHRHVRFVPKADI